MLFGHRDQGSVKWIKSTAPAADDPFPVGWNWDNGVWFDYLEASARRLTSKGERGARERGRARARRAARRSHGLGALVSSVGIPRRVQKANPSTKTSRSLSATSTATATTTSSWALQPISNPKSTHTRTLIGSVTTSFAIQRHW